VAAGIRTREVADQRRAVISQGSTHAPKATHDLRRFARSRPACRPEPRVSGAYDSKPGAKTLTAPAPAVPPGPEQHSPRDHQQRSHRLREITTKGSQHAKAGKQAREGNHPAQLRSWISLTCVTHRAQVWFSVNNFSHAFRFFAVGPEDPRAFRGRFVQFSTEHPRAEPQSFVEAATRYQSESFGRLVVETPNCGCASPEAVFR
jgi:hypothetical protein